MDRSMRLGILAGGLTLAAAVLGAYLWASWRGLGGPAAQTTAFAAWMVGHVALAAHMRAERQPLLRTNPLANRLYLLWAGAAAALLLVGAAVPFAQARLHLAPLPAEAWAAALGAGLLAPLWWEASKWLRWRRRPGG
jgi:Ca2+-transporting ATPase